MSPRKLSALFSASLAFAASAAAEEILELRLPARGAAVTAFASRSDGDIWVERDALASLGIAAPEGERIALRSVPGLTYVERPSEMAVVISCDARCYATQTLGRSEGASRAEIVTANGAYLNYDVDLQWLDGEAAAAAYAETVAFGPWGAFESSWIAHDGVRRLETRWTLDMPRQRLRLRAGDDIAIGADGARFRFGGVVVSRTFALTPNLATYPAPRFAGEALSASTVELYVDGALRAREQVEVGPFVLEHAPGAQGPGMAEIVVRDALGREQASRQPFFVTPDLLRPGLSDWIIAAGMLRQSFALDSNDYDDGFVAARYRRGISGALTLEGGFEHSARSANAFLGAAFADPLLGQFRFAHMHGEGAFMSATWLRTARSWSIGAQYDARDRETRTLATRERDTPLQSAAGHLFFDLGDAGNVSFTAASIRFDDEPSARTASATYTPDMQDGALSFRVLYVEQDEAELVFGLSYSLMLGDASAQVGADVGRAQSIYRVGAQSRPPALGGLGWRARASGGDRGRLDVATTYRGAHGESDAQLVRTDDFTGLRLGHRGSVGVVEGEHFAGRSIDGAFALVDAGAAGVRVTRDRLALGRTDAGGRLLITNLRPYDANTIAIDARDLPFDAAAPSTSVRVAPRGSAGVLVRFAEPHARLIETQARFPDGAPAPRGAILLRARDDARFPVGSDGRVVLTDAAIGDIVRLNSQATCTARADEAAAAVGLYLLCEATP